MKHVLASSGVPASRSHSSVRPGDEPERCAQEQAKALAELVAGRAAVAWLTVLGYLDWGIESLLVGRNHSDGSKAPTEAKDDATTRVSGGGPGL